MSECTVPGCGRPAIAKGWCRMHYSRARRGDPLVDDRPEVGSSSGRGRYGVLEDDGDRVMCHECGGWFAGLGGHLRPAHGLTAAEYRQRYGLPRRQALVSASVSAGLSERAEARVGSPGWKRLEAARDPSAASAAREPGVLRRALVDLDGARQRAVRNGRAARLGRVVVCAVCGAQWCTLPDHHVRVTCSDACRAEWLRRQGTGRTRNADRDASIYHLVRREGRPVRQVAAEYGMTRERVRQIVAARESSS